MEPDKIQSIIEAALMVAGKPLTIHSLQGLFSDGECPNQAEIKKIMTDLKHRYQSGGLELVEVASGYRIQAKSELSPWLSKLWEERAPRYSRAFLETLAIIAYKQPITRAEIEDIRGVSISSHIIRNLLEREWIRIIGHKEVPGKPAILGTTKAFLDHFNLKNLSELPTLHPFKNLDVHEDELQVQLILNEQPQNNIVDLHPTSDHTSQE